MNNTDFLNTDNKNEYEERIKQFADDLDVKIESMKVKTSALEQSVKQKISKNMDLLTDKRDELSDKLNEIKSSTQEQWEKSYSKVFKDIKAISNETETAYTGIKDGLNYLIDTIRK